jgi:hypothetical protein
VLRREAELNVKVYEWSEKIVREVSDNLAKKFIHLIG